ncbi:hypothetical protein VMCG_08094 [Cytospora schulzeri]|uniref:Uncharacterized protein n=1 Tax=Cytospora schulzeri TaxID=448051 RepID=A0A423VR91_9PEZI|nr:hypothetical protein VMCG_08094 [Valsa malicola]
MKIIAILNTLITVGLTAPSPVATTRSIARSSESMEHTRSGRFRSPNWAGGIVTGHNITQASRSFEVVTAKIPTEQEAGEKEYTASAWIGMGGLEIHFPEAYCRRNLNLRTCAPGELSRL